MFVLMSVFECVLACVIAADVFVFAVYECVFVL